MSYTALYRKFRPDEFEDVKGQDAIVRTLKNQINADRIGHAYLFCGTRGTGRQPCEDICESSQLRTSGRWKPVRGVRNVPVDRSWYIDECDRD